METLETLSRKIRTAHDLLSVVKTMKSLAAVNIRQYEGMAESMNEYSAVIASGWQAFFYNQPKVRARGKMGGSVFLVLGSDQGMCGQFNEVIIQHALTATQAKSKGSSPHFYWSAGERVRAGLEEEVQVAEHFPLPTSTSAIADLMFDIVERLAVLRASQKVEEFCIFYNHLGKAGSYEPSVNVVLPLVDEWQDQQRQQKWPSRSLPMLGTTGNILFENLFQQHLFAAIYKAFAQSLASENAARLAAMQAAEKNILEMEADLQGSFRETRQNSITAELLDIISGFEAIGAG